MKTVVSKSLFIDNEIDTHGINVFWLALGLLLALLLLYGFFMQATIRNVVVRTASGDNIFELISSHGVLEAEHGVMQARINASHARFLGFVEPKEPVYVLRKELARIGEHSF